MEKGNVLYPMVDSKIIRGPLQSHHCHCIFYYTTHSWIQPQSISLSWTLSCICSVDELQNTTVSWMKCKCNTASSKDPIWRPLIILSELALGYPCLSSLELEKVFFQCVIHQNREFSCLNLFLDPTLHLCPKPILSRKHTKNKLVYVIINLFQVRTMGTLEWKYELWINLNRPSC